MLRGQMPDLEGPSPSRFSPGYLAGDCEKDASAFELQAGLERARVVAQYRHAERVELVGPLHQHEEEDRELPEGLEFGVADPDAEVLGLRAVPDDEEVLVNHSVRTSEYGATSVNAGVVFDSPIADRG